MKAIELSMLTNGFLGEHAAGETFVGHAGWRVKNGHVNLLCRCIRILDLACGSPLGGG